MPWQYPDNVPNSMRYLKPSIQKKSISIANAVLRETGNEGKAIAIGISKAKKVHDKKGSIVKLAASIIIPMNHLKEDHKDLEGIKLNAKNLVKQPTKLSKRIKNILKIVKSMELDDAQAKKMDKIADEQNKNFFQRHPVLTGGIALTGGLAAADAGLSSFNKIREIGGGKSGAFAAGLKQLKGNSEVKKQVGNAALHGLGQGALYGSILSTVEPVIARGLTQKKQDHV